MANFDIHIFIIARENSCKIDRAPYGVRLIFYNAGRAPYDVFICRRRPAPVRYVTTQKKILKNRPVPGRLSNSPMMCKSLKSYDVSFICDRCINAYFFRSFFYSGKKWLLVVQKFHWTKISRYQKKEYLTAYVKSFLYWFKKDRTHFFALVLCEERKTFYIHAYRRKSYRSIYIFIHILPLHMC